MRLRSTSLDCILGLCVRPCRLQWDASKISGPNKTRRNGRARRASEINQKTAVYTIESRCSNLGFIILRHADALLLCRRAAAQIVYGTRSIAVAGSCRGGRSPRRWTTQGGWHGSNRSVCVHHNLFARHYQFVPFRPPAGRALLR